jgi:hypothetical protein
VRQYQVNLDPNKIVPLRNPCVDGIDRVQQSTNEVGGHMVEMGGAESGS